MDYEDDYVQELADIRKEIVEECMEYEDNWARAEEDGWFYSDSDEKC